MTGGRPRRASCCIALAGIAMSLAALAHAADREPALRAHGLHRVAAVASTAPTSAGATAVPAPVARLLRASGLPLSSFGIDVRPIGDTPARDLLAVNADQPFLLASTT